jgi:multiple RNA-binding domain-containing protein 1
MCSLHSPYGKLLSLRIPRKADQSPRGFAFAHFASPAQAKMALENLKHTHLLGRHLIIEPANERETL